jgi:hypothetical protein
MFQGIAYVESASVTSVPLAMGLIGHQVLEVPIIVQASQPEKKKKKLQQWQTIFKRQVLYVGSLHFNINEDRLWGSLNLLERLKISSS